MPIPSRGRLSVHRTCSRTAAEFLLDDGNAEVVAELCRRLDGLPRAIELACARLRSMALESIQTRLDQRFRLLTGGSRTALPRQKTLHALIDWSYDLLSEPERVVLERLSAFAGGFDLNAAEAVVATEEIDVFDVGEILGSLVDKSLVQPEYSPTGLRYGLLETIRAYATERLAALSGDGDRDVRFLQGLDLRGSSQGASPSSPRS